MLLRKRDEEIRTRKERETGGREMIDRKEKKKIEVEGIM